MSSTTEHQTIEARVARRGRFVKRPRRAPHSVRLKVALIHRDLTVSELARRLGLSRNYVSLLIHGGRRGAAQQARIARALGLRVSEAFPENGARDRAKPETRMTNDETKMKEAV